MQRQFTLQPLCVQLLEVLRKLGRAAIQLKLRAQQAITLKGMGG